jgi:hypothetical protein
VKKIENKANLKKTPDNRHKTHGKEFEKTNPILTAEYRTQETEARRKKMENKANVAFSVLKTAV